MNFYGIALWIAMSWANGCIWHKNGNVECLSLTVTGAGQAIIAQADRFGQRELDPGYGPLPPEGFFWCGKLDTGVSLECVDSTGGRYKLMKIGEESQTRGTCEPGTFRRDGHDLAWCDGRGVERKAVQR